MLRLCNETANLPTATACLQHKRRNAAVRLGNSRNTGREEAQGTVGYRGIDEESKLRGAAQGKRRYKMFVRNQRGGRGGEETSESKYETF